MTRWSSREELVNEIVNLRRQGMSRNAIARALGISKNTASDIIKEHDLAREEPHSALPSEPSRAPRATKLDPHKDYIRNLLEHFDGITAQRIFEKLKEKNYSGGYTAVKDYLRKVRPAPKPEPSRETPVSGPGELAESDWTPHLINFTTGRRLKIQVFDYALRYSTRKAFFIFERCDIHATMDGHVKAFERFGGAAHECKYDTQKPVVLRWEGEQPIYNPRFLAFATHYEFRPRACRRGRPNEKPRAERSFWEFEQSFLNGREFRDLEDMRAQLSQWQETISDPRPHKRLKRPRMDLFAEESAHLRPLPVHPYDTARVLYKLCNIEGDITWDGNRYAVPYEHVTDFLPVRITQHEIFIYAADLSLVERYELAPRSAGADVDPRGLHRPATHRAAVDLEQLENVFAGIGEEGEGAEFFAAMKTHAPKQCGFQARQILLLRDLYSTEDLARALRQARAFDAFERSAVLRILEVRARPRRLEEYVAEALLARHGEAIRSTSSGPRDLAEYDQLPTVSAPSDLDARDTFQSDSSEELP